MSRQAMRQSAEWVSQTLVRREKRLRNLRGQYTAMWHLVDGKDQVVGRLAVQIAHLLRGKHKPTFRRDKLCGDNVVVINARDMVFSGDKRKKKIYYWHTGYPGGIKKRTPQDYHNLGQPEWMLFRAVRGMLPKNRLRDKFMSQLKIYPGPVHFHQDELPEGTESILPAHQGAEEKYVGKLKRIKGRMRKNLKPNPPLEDEL